jgi:hypothetical protein
MDDPGNRLWAAGASLALAVVLALGCSGGFGRTDGGTDAAWDAGTDGDAGEPNLDAAGNLYFVHHFFSAELHKVEGDIYVCPRR